MTTPRTALLHAATLAAYLKDRLPHCRTDALLRLAEVLLGILQAESALHRKIALHLPRSASLESKTRTVARVFHDLQLTSQDVLDVLLPLLPDGKLTLVMDSTFLGRTDAHEDACPHLALWTDPTQYPRPRRCPRWGGTPLDLDGVAPSGQRLGQSSARLEQNSAQQALARMRTLGRSSGAARILLVAQLLKVLPAKRWAVLMADRRASVLMGAALLKNEFVGKQWCMWLRWKGIKRCFRIKENTLTPGQRSVPGPAAWRGPLGVREGMGVRHMDATITLSPAGDRVIVASNLSVLDTLFTYKKRWGVECTFSAMKARGLGLEDTHMTAPDRLSRLFGLLCIVLAWMVRVGEAAQESDPPTLDNRGRKARSTARTGWTLLSQAVRWGLDTFWTYLDLLKIAFPSLKCV